MKKLFFLILPLLGSLLFLSCSESITNPRGTIFPYMDISPGTLRTYEKTDSLAGNAKTNVYHKVLSVRLSGTATVYRLELNSQSYTDTIDLSVEINTLSFYGNLTEDRNYFRFPLRAGDTWKNPLTGIVDSFTVEGRETIVVNGIAYDVWKIRRSYGGLNEYGEKIFYYDERKGFVRITFNEWGYNFSNYILNLK